MLSLRFVGRSGYGSPMMVTKTFRRWARATMFEQENALPGSKLHLPIDNRHGLAGAH
jgi:hypothetical protein